ncbi:Leucine-rich repeat-containing protein 58 [Halotydeus destructor]|nr:Leucine-rich repeat-containing protein 58 [Halotydeus destructor]
MFEDSDSSRSRASSSSDSSLLGHPIAIRRLRSRAASDAEDDTSSIDLCFMNYENSELETHLAPMLKIDPLAITSINFSNNQLKWLPESIFQCRHLQVLDVSQNQLSEISSVILHFTQLSTLIASNNLLGGNSFPKSFSDVLSGSLKVLSLGGNLFKNIPAEFLELSQLRSLYLGANQISEIPRDIKKLCHLRALYLGGNQLTCVPHELGHLHSLQSLSLCENRLSCLPPTIADLRNLRSLALHKNQLTTLPQEIVRIRGLQELSLRNNPLVVRFVKDFTFETPTLLELAGRAVKVNKLKFTRKTLPVNLVDYLEAARRCVNPKCKGVYFESHVEDIKFVDFCGIYRLPLLQFLCSPGCSDPHRATYDASSDSEDEEVPSNKLKRMLLG